MVMGRPRIKSSFKNVTPKNMAYIAGILDGEGCFLFQKNGQARAEVVSIDEELIDWLIQKTGVGIKQVRSMGGNRHDQWRWCVYRKEDFRALVTEVLPLLVIKRRIERANYILGRL